MKRKITLATNRKKDRTQPKFYADSIFRADSPKGEHHESARKSLYGCAS